MATLAEEIRALLQSIGPDLIPQAQGLPAVAPQSVQSGNPTPQNVGQTLGPQPGDPRNATRQQLGQEFTQAAGSFAASAADPLGIPSAITGMVSPEMRDAWRQYQGAAGPVVQMAGSLASGIPAGLGMMSGVGRIGNAMAGSGSLANAGGRVAGAAGASSAPTIDYLAGAPGSSATNALAAPAIGALLAGQGSGLGSAMRPYLMPAAAASSAAGLGASVIGDVGPAEAQSTGGRPKGKGGPAPQSASGSPVEQLDSQTQTLHRTNPEVRTLYEQMQTARRDRDRARAIAQRRDNDAATAAAASADQLFTDSQTRYTDAVRRATQSSLPFDQAFPNISQNYALLQFAGPAALGYAVRGGGNAMINAYTEPWRRAVRGAERNLDRVIGAAPGSPAERIAMGRGMAAANTATSYLDDAGRPPAVLNAMNTANNVAPVIAGGALGAELSLLPHQHNRRLPEGTPGRDAADNALANPLAQVMTAAPGVMAGGLGGFTGSHIPFLPMLGRQIPAPTERTEALRRLMRGDVRPEMENFAANINAMRPPQVQQQPQRPALPPPVNPPPPPIAPPAGSNLPTDFESILRGIGESVPRVRGVRGPVGSNPAAPGLSYDVSSNGADMFRQAVAEHLRSGNLLTGFNVADFRRRVVDAAQSAGATESQVASVRVFRDALDRLQQLIASEGLSPAQAARRITAANRRGGFENFAVPVMAGGGAAAAAHHSASQPRGDDGRFTTP